VFDCGSGSQVEFVLLNRNAEKAMKFAFGHDRVDQLLLRLRHRDFAVKVRAAEHCDSVLRGGGTWERRTGPFNPLVRLNQ